MFFIVYKNDIGQYLAVLKICIEMWLFVWIQDKTNTQSSQNIQTYMYFGTENNLRR